MGWEISKSFSFCYGHRVWNQLLDPILSSGASCKCRHLHGHEGTVEIGLQSLPGAPLVNGVVTDFNNLGWLKNFLDATIDHRFIIDRNDPVFAQMLPEQNLVWSFKNLSLHTGSVTIPSRNLQVGYFANILDEDLSASEIEYYESFFIVDFVPTSENLSKWLFELVSFMMQGTCKVSYVDWWETPKSHAKYVGEL